MLRPALRSLVPALGATWLACAALAPPSVAEGSLRAIPSALDLGERPPAATVPAEVWIVNTASDPVDVLSVKGLCGCLAVRGFRPATLAAGAALPVALEVRAPKEAGARKETAFVVTSSAGAPVRVAVELDVVATPAEEPSATSPAALAGAVAVVDPGALRAAVGGTSAGSAWLFHRGEAPVRVLDVRGSCGCVTVEGPKAFELAPGAAREIPFRVRAAAAPGGPSAKELRIVTDGGVLEAAFEVTTVEG